MEKTFTTYDMVAEICNVWFACQKEYNPNLCKEDVLHFLKDQADTFDLDDKGVQDIYEETCTFGFKEEEKGCVSSVSAEQVIELIEQATTPIKSSTHKVIKAFYYAPETLYAVPNSWSIDDIYIRYGTIYYKGVDVEKYIKEYECEGDRKYPEKIQDDEYFELDDYFDCEEEEIPKCITCNKKNASIKDFYEEDPEEDKKYWKQCDKCFKIDQEGESEEEFCDDCEGACKSKETEECDKCGIELPIGCGNNPSDESIFNGCCDDCRENRYCDNDDCLYEGYCFDEVKEEFEGKSWICYGCTTGKGVQEEEHEQREQSIDED